MTRTAAAAFGLLLSLVAAPVRGEPPTKAEVEAYLDQITKSHGRLNAAGQDFGRALGPAVKGDATDQLKLYRSYRSMAQVLWGVIQDTKGWKVPDHPAAQQVRAANERFLDYQFEVMLSKLPALLEILDDASLSGDDKSDKILTVIKRDNEREVELGTDLRARIEELRKAVP